MSGTYGTVIDLPGHDVPPEWPKLFRVEGAIVYTVGGEVVGSIDAVYEVPEGFPPELLKSFLQGGFPVRAINVNLNAVAHHYWPDRYKDPFADMRAAQKTRQDRWDRFWAWVGTWNPWRA